MRELLTGGGVIPANEELIDNLQQKGLIDKNLTPSTLAYEKLKQYRVKNAIILAAGFGSRFAPVTFEIPKGLISVKGEILIERQIEQLRAAGIQEIVIVIGYMAEKFLYLRDKYNVNIVINNNFSTRNTYSSIYAARDYLSNTYVLCADNYYPQNLFSMYEYRAFYSSIFLHGTGITERALTFDDDGLIYDTNKPSFNQYIMYGHAYFDEAFTAKFRPILEEYFARSGTENMYWENVWCENLKTIPMWIKKYNTFDILEFDSMEELQAFDSDYISCNKVKIFENICRVLCCDYDDIDDISIIKQGLNNRSFKFRIKYSGEYYIYRHPGRHAQSFIDRKREAISLRAAKRLNIDSTLVYMDVNEGWKISKFIDVSEDFDFGNKAHIDMLAEKLKTLHASCISAGSGFDYQFEAEKIITTQKSINAATFREFLKERETMIPIFNFLEHDKWQVSLCHNDLYEPNLLVKNASLNIIDWEFAGDADIGFDICKLFAVNNPPFEEIDYWLEGYFGRKTTDQEKTHLISCSAVIYYYWYIWGSYTMNDTPAVSEYVPVWREKMKSFRAKALELINH